MNAEVRFLLFMAIFQVQRVFVQRIFRKIYLERKKLIEKVKINPQMKNAKMLQNRQMSE